MAPKYKPLLVKRFGAHSTHDWRAEGYPKACQKLYRFPNGYGASVVRHRYSYGGKNGLWELAVVVDMDDAGQFTLCYDTPIASDVLGHLTSREVTKTLTAIAALPPRR